MFEKESCSELLKNLDRLEALAETQLYGTAPEEAFSRLNRLATKLLNVPISIFSLIGDKSQFFKSAAGFTIDDSNNEVPIDVSVCQYSLQGKPLAIEDTLAHPVFSDNPAVKALNIVGYLGIPIITKTGHPIGAVCVIDHKKRSWSEDEISILEEITSSFLSEIELRQALTKAKREARLREEFISVAAHELKNPLNVLQLQSQTFRRASEGRMRTPDELEKYLLGVEKQIRRMTMMIDDMGDLARLSNDVFTLRRKPVDLEMHFLTVVENFKEEWRKVGSAVEIVTEKNIIVEIDTLRIEQVLSNLFTNTLKYAPGTLIKLKLVKKNDSAEILVSDGGQGIPKKYQEDIFAKYARQDNNQSVMGLGLGLYISRQIAVQHGGELSLQSEHGHGATFILRLPLKS